MANKNYKKGIIIDYERLMKNFILLSTILLSCIACGKDDTQTDPLIDRWHLFSKEEIATENGSSKHRIDTMDYRDSYIEFTSAGTLLTVEGNGKYNVKDDSVYIFIDYTGNDQETEGVRFKYKVNGDVLTLESSQQHFETHYVDRINYKRL